LGTRGRGAKGPASEGAQANRLVEGVQRQRRQRARGQGGGGDKKRGGQQKGVDRRKRASTVRLPNAEDQAGFRWRRREMRRSIAASARGRSVCGRRRRTPGPRKALRKRSQRPPKKALDSGFHGASLTPHSARPTQAKGIASLTEESLPERGKKIDGWRKKVVDKPGTRR
jgi:hypothetical protein